MHRFRRPLALSAASLVIASGSLATAQPAAPKTATPAAAPGKTDTTAKAKPTSNAGAKPKTSAKPTSKAHKEAVEHFQNGVKLYQDKNYNGALAEFEAAYQLKPGAPSLQNIALCLKALFRYAEAADTLEKLLDRHGSEIDAQERAQVQAAIKELSSLVGSIDVKVTPPDARVTVDGHKVEKIAREKGVRLDVGEHTVVASAPGYTSVSRVVRVAGGETHIPVNIALTPTMGFVSVNVDDKDAAIAIDGKPLAFQHWSGPLTPGQHYVQVYKKGFKPFEQRFTVELGQKQSIDAALGPPVAEEDTGSKKGNTSTGHSRQLRGWYAMGSLDLTSLTGDPKGAGIQRPSGKTIPGGGLGVRAGYRLWTPVSVELLVEGSSHQAKDQCVTSCDSGVTRDYTVQSFRLGPNLRINSGGEMIRFTSALGLGAVQHTVKFGAFKPTDYTPPKGSDVPDNGVTASGWDPYLLLEIGAQFNLGHVLLEADAIAYIDQASSVHYGDNKTPYEQGGSGTGGIKMLGLGLRAGWSEWAPPSKVSKITQLTR